MPSGWASHDTRDRHALLCTVWPQYLTLEEASDIIEQFNGLGWVRDNQLLWSGVEYAEVERTANEHNMQTLRVAMGPLMDPGHPRCLKSKKKEKAWSKYIKGASLIFAWRISQGEVATIMTPPPPDCFHPSEMTNLQDIELPVLRGDLGNRPVSKIFLWHPTVEGAQSFKYQIWPQDHTSSWYQTFDPRAKDTKTWRVVSKHRVSTKWAVNTTVRRLVTLETFGKLKRLSSNVRISINVADKMVLLLKLFYHSAVLLLIIARLVLQVVVAEEAAPGETGEVTSASSSKVKPNEESRITYASKINQPPSRLTTVNISAMTVSGSSSTDKVASSEVDQGNRLPVHKVSSVDQPPSSPTAVATSAVANPGSSFPDTMAFSGASHNNKPPALKVSNADQRPLVLATSSSFAISDPGSSSAPAEGSSSSPTLGKRAAKALRKLQRAEVEAQVPISNANGKKTKKKSPQ
ncbi:hypothetical protein CH063_01932 [Colletotrichum higginsianum]|nr:hypothetical protein CH063_01932 [Colletotrichum higginsianum]